MQTFSVYNEFGTQDEGLTPHAASSITPSLTAASNAAQRYVDAIVGSSRSEEGLFKLLRGARGGKHDRTPDVLNLAQYLIAKAWPLTHTSTHSSQRSTGPPERRLLSIDAIGVFKRTLHRILLVPLYHLRDTNPQGHRVSLSAQQNAATGLHARQVAAFAAKGMAVSEDAMCAEILDDKEALRGLVNACIEVVALANAQHIEECFPAATIKIDRQMYGVELVHGLRWLRQAADGPSPGSNDDGFPPLPAELEAYFSLMEGRILEELAFVHGSSLYARIVHAATWHDGAAATLPAPFNASLVAAFIRDLGRLAQSRELVLRDAVAQKLSLASQPGGPQVSACLGAAAFCALSSLLFHHLDALFSHNLSVVLVICYYYTAKLHGIRGLTLLFLARVARQCLPCQHEDVFLNVPLTPVSSFVAVNKAETEISIDDSDDDGLGWISVRKNKQEEEHRTAFGNLKQYYNDIMLPLLQSMGAEALYGPTSAALAAALQDMPGGGLFLGIAAQPLGGIDKTPPRFDPEEEAPHVQQVMGTIRKSTAKRRALECMPAKQAL